MQIWGVNIQPVYSLLFVDDKQDFVSFGKFE